VTVLDLLTVEILVLEISEEALDDAVGPGRAVAVRTWVNSSRAAM
jgi:hypothetical protein